MFQQAKRVFLGAALAAGFGFAALPAQAASVNVTFHNETDSTYDLYDVTTSSYISISAPGNNADGIAGGTEGSIGGGSPTDTVYSLSDTDTYRVAQGFGHAASGVGHTFTISGGNVISSNANAFFDPSGDTVTLAGIALTAQVLPSSTVGIGENPLMFFAGAAAAFGYVNGGGTSVYTGVNSFAPADGFFTGDLGQLQLFEVTFDNGAPSADDVQLTSSGITVTPALPSGGFTYTYTPLATNIGILSITDGSNTENIQFNFAVPEPASLSLIGIGGLMMLRRGKRNSR